MKQKTRKYIRVSSLTIASLATVGLIIGVSTAWNGEKSISIGGSSAVMPLINKLSNEYPKADIVTSVGGSGVGISSILNNSKEIGIASKNPKMVPIPPNTPDTNQEKWKEIRAKTFTIAWDGIALIYKPKPNTSNNLNKIIDINEESLAMIYSAFSGIRQISLEELLGETTNSNSTKVIPFARNGGATTSGTADAFLHDSNINWKSSKYFNGLNHEEKKEIEIILQNGSYKNDVYETSESNSQTWNRVKGGKYGSMTYLSTGFIFNNYNEIINNGFKIMTYKSHELFKKENKNELFFNSEYKWFRPFNLMVSLNTIENNKLIKDFICWILTDKKAKKIIEKEGYLNLDSTQINSMINNDPNNANIEDLFKKSDYDLGYCGAKF